MAKKRQGNYGQAGRIIIACPTLEMLLTSCNNTKEIAYLVNMDYSNFLKACKFQKDIRFSSYRKCAESFSRDILIIHLPCELTNSKSNPKEHYSKQYHTISHQELKMILLEIIDSREFDLSHIIKSILTTSSFHNDKSLLRELLTSIITICQNLLKNV